MGKFGWLLILAGLFGLCTWQIVHLHRLQSDFGDDFYAHSTYRADPWGLRALYNALGALPGVHVERNEVNLDRIGPGADSTLIIAGAYSGADPATTVMALDNFVRTGGRLLIAMEAQYYDGDAESPWTDPDEADSSTEEADANAEDDETPAAPAVEGATPAEDSPPPGTDTEPGDPASNDTDEEDSDDFLDTETVWDYQVNSAPILGVDEDDDDPAGVALRASEHPQLPERLPWYSELHFGGSGPDWKPIYTRDTFPVVLERSLGAGSIVLCSDTYLMSNEAQRIDRNPAFLAWLIGSSKRVIFDEYHLGVSRDPNAMLLLRRYRLHYVLVALFGIALLFLWQSASPLMPRRSLADAAHRDQWQAQQAQAQALPYLLRRSVDRIALMSTCYGLWRDSAGRRRGLPQATDLELRAIVRDVTSDGAKTQALVHAYQLLTQRIQKRSCL